MSINRVYGNHYIAHNDFIIEQTMILQAHNFHAASACDLIDTWNTITSGDGYINKLRENSFCLFTLGRFSTHTNHTHSSSTTTHTSLYSSHHKHSTHQRQELFLGHFGNVWSSVRQEEVSDVQIVSIASKIVKCKVLQVLHERAI